MNWFWKLIDWLFRRQAIRLVLNRWEEYRASSQPERPLFVWTREEAEAAWKTNRTKKNLALTLPENLTAVQSCAGIFVVDGKPARVVICVDESAKQWMTKQQSRSIQVADERKAKEERPKTSTQIGEENNAKEESPKTAAQIREDIEAEEKRRKARENIWLENGCVQYSSGSWEIPDDLMWRSLPHGEDR